jgi:hypothetical protein
VQAEQARPATAPVTKKDETKLEPPAKTQIEETPDKFLDIDESKLGD